MRVARRGVDLGRLDDVDEMVRDALLRLGRHLVGADVEAAIDRGRVAGDDLAAEVTRHRQRQRRLAGGRRSEDGDEGGRSAQHAICLTTSAASSATTASRPSCWAGVGGHCYGVGDSLKKNVTVKNALSAGYSGGSGWVGFDASDGVVGRAVERVDLGGADDVARR